MGNAPGFIYVMFREDGLRKLGTSVDVRRRAAQWTADTGIVHSIEMVWELGTARAARQIEIGLHRLLAHLRVDGAGSRETYSMSIDTLSLIVSGSILNARYPVKVCSPPTPKRQAYTIRMNELIAEAQRWCDDNPQESEAMVARLRKYLSDLTRENNEAYASH